MSDLSDLIKEDIAALFSITPPDAGYTRVRGPFILPDGDTLDLYFIEANGAFEATDMGDANSYLWMNSARAEMRAPELKPAIAKICKRHNVKFDRGSIIARAATVNDLADALFRAGLAAMRVADLDRSQAE